MQEFIICQEARGYYADYCFRRTISGILFYMIVNTLFMQLLPHEDYIPVSLMVRLSNCHERSS